MELFRIEEKQNYLAKVVGRCDRIFNCGYHYPPKSFFTDHPHNLSDSSFSKRQPEIRSKSQPKSLDYIPYSFLQRSLKGYYQNNFTAFLFSLFSDTITRHLIKQFHIGSSKRWKGATVFWQVDYSDRVRQAKVMLYHRENGKRVKAEEIPNVGQSKIFFAGKSILKREGTPQPNLWQCFFGEHQLKHRLNATVGIVESEKTTILLSALIPELIWLATGGKAGCRWSHWETYQVLKKRKVILFPDLGCFEDWSTKAERLQTIGCMITTSTLLEDHANQSARKQGLDLADYFIQRDLSLGWALNQDQYPVFWDWKNINYDCY